MTWHLLTGEFPPVRGGIADYTARLARALADAGDEVHVWTARADAGDVAGVAVHGIGGFHGGGLDALGRRLDAHPAPRRLLVQYAPQAFGRRGMNLAFCRWLLARRRAGDDVRVMFHEPFFPFGWQRPRRNVLAVVHRLMAATLLRAASHAYVSTEAWVPLLRPYAPRALRIDPLPIPSTIPRVSDPVRLYALRGRLTAGGTRPVVAHFGTCGALIAPGLEDALLRVAGRVADAHVLLLGAGSERFAARLLASHPSLRGRVTATGAMDAADVSLHLQASDAALQPYPDGADTRRTTLMAALANGVPTVTTRGRFTEPVWDDSPVVLAPAGDAGAIADAVAEVLSFGRREEVGARTAAFHDAAFAMPNTVARLRADAGEGAG